MRTRILGLAAAALLLAGCNPSVEDLMQEITVAELKAELRDPDSLELSETRIQVADGVGAICGYMNAANGYGGMAGRERFVRVFDRGDMEALTGLKGSAKDIRDAGWDARDTARRYQREAELKTPAPPEPTRGLFIESTSPIYALRMTANHCIREARPIALKP